MNTQNVLTPCAIGRLVPTHPDRAAGLGFLSVSVFAMSLFILAHGVLLSGLIANRIFYAGAKLMDFKLEAIALIAVVMMVVLGPLLAFSPQLLRAKRAGLRTLKYSLTTFRA